MHTCSNSPLVGGLGVGPLLRQYLLVIREGNKMSINTCMHYMHTVNVPGPTSACFSFAELAL